MRLGEQIAVLDGLSTIDPSDGANYGGGSNYAARMPLLPSTVGLAAATQDLLQASRKLDQARAVRAVAANANTRSNVIDPSEGANMSGGSCYADRMPLMPSTIGLSGVGIVDPGEGMHGGGSSYPDGGRWPLLPSTVGLAGLASLADNLLAKKGVKVKKKPATGSVVNDAYTRFMSTIAALRLVVANPKTPGTDRQNAQLLVNAMNTAWRNRMGASKPLPPPGYVASASGIAPSRKL